MANSPNYNWTEPDNTGYVKNGALDMRTLGNAIDNTVYQIASYKQQVIHPFLMMGA
jgi:hypothetical protein